LVLKIFFDDKTMTATTPRQVLLAYPQGADFEVFILRFSLSLLPISVGANGIIFDTTFACAKTVLFFHKNVETRGH
jgi:hypothetical protein